MLFNSLAFLVFFPSVILVYWLLPARWRNLFLLVASYYFYMNWEPIYALLILSSTLITWASGIFIERLPRHKKLILVSSICINFAALIVFKYANFINETVKHVLYMFHINIDIPYFNLLLPVGISFYVFQAVGYTIDIYRNRIRAERSLWVYALFVSFFPQLVAGPIERAGNLLPQFHSIHKFDSQKVTDGLYLMLWGYFMKLCIADNVSTYVDAVYNNLDQHTGTSVLLATFFFSFQIFCDFGGYSLIAIGAARCMGFRLMRNFNHPYLATSIHNFWRRWHISLTTWFTDYVYIPLGGNRCSALKHHRNILTTFLVSGIWHGANMTFIVWGLYHGALQSANVLKSRYKKNLLPVNILSNALNIITTFVLVMMGWVWFRANSLSDAITAYKKMFTDHGTLFKGEGIPSLILPMLLIIVLIAKEIKDEHNETDLTQETAPGTLTVSLKMSLLLIVILLCASFNGGQFIYFQF